jgi:hypothetical protein
MPIATSTEERPSPPGRLTAMHGWGESYSDVILRLVRLEAG